MKRVSNRSRHERLVTRSTKPELRKWNFMALRLLEGHAKRGLKNSRKDLADFLNGLRRSR